MDINNINYDEIKKSYNDTRNKNIYLQEQRIKEIYEKIPQIKLLDDNIRNIAFETFKDFTKSGKKDIFDVSEKKIEKIKKNRQRLLKLNKYPIDYTDLKYNCNLCKDTGYEKGRKCICHIKKEIEYLYNFSKISEVLMEENFNNLSFEYYDNTKNIEVIDKTNYEHMKKVVDICKKYVDGFENSGGNIFFTGNTGVGKSFLANCIAKELIEKLKLVLRLNATELVEIMKNNAKSFEYVNNDYKYLTQSDLLIIDDLGTELCTEWNNSCIFNIIEERLLSNKSTIITTNLGFNEVRDRYSERVSSRIFSKYELIPMYGSDIRMKKIKQ